MTNQQLHELAAKAAGLEGFEWDAEWECMQQRDKELDLVIAWQPRTYDDDALELAVTLQLTIQTAHCGTSASVIAPGGERLATVLHGDDPAQAVRDAILHAAAELGGREHAN